MASKGKSEKKQHIQVFTRVRPLNSQELRSQVVVECMNSREVSVRDKSQTKTFQFDRVFGPDSKQVDVYKSVVNPLIEEVLQGYNCTVFAYGQTGTGKTFTMVGEKSQDIGTSWEDDPNSGIIPRTLSHLFDELKIRAEEFTVRVSFLELYNEELCDLLAPNDADDSKSLRLFEDSTKKGSVIVSGLEERTVHNKDDVYAILAAGNLRRQTAPTLMNAQSSRSHTIFTITVHIKVTTPEGEDLIKTGKLNLVDLAGSENIGRSGAVDMRAREAGNINQSLLTLGRVITSLVERTPHVPYRESKLTRILQDSLGGRTKTSIIATVSPALCNIEETLSTFDYAHRARNITNKPEINQKTSKRALIKEYTEEIERLRRDLIAAREKHGVYLAPENYNAIMAERDHLNKELINKLQLLKAREDEKAEQDEMLKRLNDSLNATLGELQKTQKLCNEKENELNEANKEAVQLFEKAVELDSDKNTLHDRLDRSRRIQEHNLDAAEKFKNYICSKFMDNKNRAKNFLSEIVPQIREKNEFDCKFLTLRENNLSEIKTETEEFIKNSKNQLQNAMDVYINQITSLNNFLTEQQQSAEFNIDSEKSKCEEMKSDFIEFSNNLTAHREMLMGGTSDVVDRLKAQRRNLQEIETNTSGVKSVVIDLPEILKVKNQKYEERLRLNEENIKALKVQAEEVASDEEEMIRKRANLVDQQARLLEEMKFLDSELEKIVESRKDLNERLKSIEKENEDLRKELLSQTMINIVDTASALNDGLSKTQEIIKSTSNPMDLTIRSIEESLKSIDTMKLIEEESTSKFVKSTEQTTTQNVEKLQNLIHLIQLKIDEASVDFTNVKNPLSNTFKNLERHDNDMKEFLVQENTAIKNFHNESQTRQQSILSNITEYAEESFSNTHAREKEIKMFFEEGIQKDEKTGSTPQRKEFNYPKRVGILKIKNENEGS